MNAMTWWDHETESVWSQIWGQAIAGPLKGTTLKLIPASIVPWSTWKAEHPNTLAMTNDKTGTFSPKEHPRDEWVIGIKIGPHSKAYYYDALTRDGIVNDAIGPYPITLYADATTRNVHVYLRQAGEEELMLALADDGERLIDERGGGKWDLALGLAENEEANGETLLKVPYLSSFDWAWMDFHPNSELYR